MDCFFIKIPNRRKTCTYHMAKGYEEYIMAQLQSNRGFLEDCLRSDRIKQFQSKKNADCVSDILLSMRPPNYLSRRSRLLKTSLGHLKENSIEMENDYYFVRQVDFAFGDLSVYQQNVGDVGHVVWDAALVLSKFIDGKYFNATYGLKNKTVMELGAGTGIVGMVAGMHGASVYITDLKELIPLMQKNIQANKMHQNVKAQELKWGEESSLSSPDYLFIADCIYYAESLQPLVTTMKQLCSKDTNIFLSYEERNTEHKIKLQKDFFELISQHFEIDEIAQEFQDPLFHSDDIHVLRLSVR